MTKAVWPAGDENELAGVGVDEGAPVVGANVNDAHGLTGEEIACPASSLRLQGRAAGLLARPGGPAPPRAAPQTHSGVHCI